MNEGVKSADGTKAPKEVAGDRDMKMGSNVVERYSGKSGGGARIGYSGERVVEGKVDDGFSTIFIFS